MKPYSEYGRIFDCTNFRWRRNQKYNLNYCNNMLASCNQVLEAQGYLFLNDVFRIFHIPRIQEGQTIGWTIDAMTKNGVVESIGFCEPVDHPYNVIIDFHNIQENILHALPKNKEL